MLIIWLKKILVIGRMTGLILALNNLGLIGCSAPQTESSHSSVVKTEGQTLTASATPKRFILPSGNIYCALVGTNQDALRCEIASLLNPLPPQPADCQFDWGAGFFLPQQSPATILCISDTIASNDYTLAYGSTWTHAGFECQSHQIGLTCKNSHGQGFFLSREQWKIFSHRELNENNR